MLKKERENEIINILHDNDGFATVKDLCKIIYASEASIRRDLTALESMGIVHRVYGGAELVNIYSAALDFKSRAYHNKAEKQIIAKKAARLVKESEVIFLDQSSSAFYLACELLHKSNLTVATNNIEIIRILSDSNIKVISSGGLLSRENRTCLIGSSAQKTFESIYADKVFFSTKALSADGIIADCAIEEVYVREAMLNNAKEKIFLCDSEKIGTAASYRQWTLDKTDFLVTDKDEISLKGFDKLKIL